MPHLIAKFEICRDGVKLSDFLVPQSIVTLGRASDNVLALREDPTISRHHACIFWTAEGYSLMHLGGVGATYLNGTLMPANTNWPLTDGDLIEIGRYSLRFCVEQLASQPRQLAQNEETTQVVDFTELPSTSPPSQQLKLQGRQTLTIGRDPVNNVVIDHPAVSRNHAQIKHQRGKYIIFDGNSTNGTFVNGKPVAVKQELTVGDTIRIGPARFRFDIEDTLAQVNEEGNLRLDAVHLNKVIRPGLNLLSDISLSIAVREFVAIAGVSGGGKSTLLDALNGFRPATSGAVLVNGTDLYKNFNAYRTEIGYVPQRDIVHMELTVAEALDYAAQLRMPVDMTRIERRRRIIEVLQDLDLYHCRNVPVQDLSGGQIKRVSIGVELLTRPSLFYLDEATSGLDPGMEAELMQLLRLLADQGRTILLITHATENVVLCDQVVFMAKGGHLAYFGPPQEAVQYFGVEKFNQIYRKVEHELSPEQWQQLYLQSPQYQKYIARRQQLLPDRQGQGGCQRPRQSFPGAQVKHISSWRQFLVLSQRNLTILWRDRASLILMLAVAPMLGLLDIFAWQSNLFNVEDGDATQAITMLFTTGLIAVMVGSLSTMREIVKELDIYRRERMIGLQILPYILSKVWVGLLLAFYQAAIFLAFKLLAVDLPRTPVLVMQMYFTLVLASVAGMMLGLLGSAISSNQNVAPLIAIIFLVPQIIFGGGVLPVHTFTPPGQLINRISMTKWPFESLMTISGIGKDVAADQCWALPEAEREGLTDYQKQDCPCLGPSIFSTCEFPGIRSPYKSALDQPEPVKPTSPGDPPNRDQLNLITFQKEVEIYLNQVATYLKDLTAWQQKYSNWKQLNQQAIAKAEGTIARFQKDYGATFAVNVTQHWLILGCLTMGMFAVIVAVQKLKDMV